MRYQITLLSAFICILAVGCSDEGSETKTETSFRDLSDHRIFSFDLNGVGRGYATPKMPKMGELAGLIDEELDLRFGGKVTPEHLEVQLDDGDVLKLSWEILHLDGKGGVHYRLRKLITAEREDGGQYRVEYFGSPFASPTLAGSYPSIQEAVEAIKSKVAQSFEGYQAMWEATYEPG